MPTDNAPTKAPESSAPAPSTAAASSAGSAASGESPRILTALEHLKAILVPGETLEAYAVQRRGFALTRRRMMVAATTGRFIVVERGMFGGFTPTDVRWQDVEEAHVHVGMLAASLAVKALQRQDLASANSQGGVFGATGLRKGQTEAVYRACQAQSQAWREKRRVRDLDEMRAKSGGLQFGTPAGVPSSGPADSGDAAGRLKQAKEMLAGGLITDAEYEAIKARVVDRM